MKVYVTKDDLLRKALELSEENPNKYAGIVDDVLYLIRQCYITTKADIVKDFAEKLRKKFLMMECMEEAVEVVDELLEEMRCE